MSLISEVMVGEFFELNGFFVRQQRKYVGPGVSDGQGVDFFVLNSRRTANAPNRPFELKSGDLGKISRAVVVVKAWHTEIFTATFLAQTPTIYRFAEPEVFRRIQQAFGGDEELLKILVIPAWPQGAEARAESMNFLRARGIDGVFQFKTILANLVEQVESSRNYQKSDLMQVLRILASYDMIKEPQLELFRARRRAGRSG